jgi:hypothetical protein
MYDLNTFTRTINPYRGKYAELVNDPFDLFDNKKWITKHEYLSNYKIAQSISGIVKRAYYSCTMPQCLSIDIDDHHGTAWKGQVQASPYLLGLYQTVCSRLGHPSFLVQSPRGLHSYYVFNQRIPSNILLDNARQKIKTNLVEIKPTLDTALRIPEQDTFLDPMTLAPCDDFDFDSMTVYHPALIIGMNCLADTIKKTTLKDRKTIIKNLNKSHVKRVEAENPFLDGNSNETLNLLIPVYKRAGLSVQEAFERIDTLIGTSQFYTRKPDTTGQRLKKRVECYYNREYIHRIEPVKQTNLFDDPAVMAILELSPFSKQREKPIKTFLQSLYQWKNYQDEIYQDKARLAWFDYLYPFYRNNRKKGLYPLPRNLMTRWNQRYFEITTWLHDIGILEASQYRYKPGGGICKYYRIKDTGHIWFS